MENSNSFNSNDNKECKNIKDILSNMRSDEKEHVYSCFGDTYLKYRRVVIEWMVDVCEYFNLDPVTTHAAVAYLDRLQPNDRYTRYEWQMLAISCILISSKFHETEDIVPDRMTLEDITQQPITNATILSYEVFALKSISWKLNARTAMSFLSCYMALGLLDGTEECHDYPNHEERKVLLHKKINYYASLTMYDHSFKHFKASDIAIAIICVSKQDMEILPVWTPKLLDMVKTDPNKQSIFTIVNMINDIEINNNILLSPNRTFLPETPISSSHRVINDNDECNKENSGPKEKHSSPTSVTGI